MGERFRGHLKAGQSGVRACVTPQTVKCVEGGVTAAGRDQRMSVGTLSDVMGTKDGCAMARTGETHFSMVPICQCQCSALEAAPGARVSREVKDRALSSSGSFPLEVEVAESSCEEVKGGQGGSDSEIRLVKESLTDVMGTTDRCAMARGRILSYFSPEKEPSLISLGSDTQLPEAIEAHADSGKEPKVWGTIVSGSTGVKEESSKVLYLPAGTDPEIRLVKESLTDVMGTKDGCAMARGRIPSYFSSGKVSGLDVDQTGEQNSATPILCPKVVVPPSVSVSTSTPQGCTDSSPKCRLDEKVLEKARLSSKGMTTGRVISGHRPNQISVVGRLGSNSGVWKAPSIEMLVDTGAEMSFVSEDTFRRCGTDVQLEAADMRLKAINGSSVRVGGKCHLTVGLQGRKFDQTFIVADIGDEAVLGMDFLRRYRCQWDWEAEKLVLGGVTIPCNSEPDFEKKACEVVTLEDLLVPAMSEKVVAGKVRNAKEAPVLGMVEGPTAGEGVVLVAHCLVRRHNQLVPVRLMNPSLKDIRLARGQVVAGLHPVQIMENIPESHVRAVKPGETSVSLVTEMEELWARGGEHLGKPEQVKMRELLEEYQDVFATKGNSLGQTHLVEHQIDTGDARPIKQRPRREPLGLQDVVQTELRDMLEKDVIEPSASAWASPVVLVKKKDGSIRFCIDYRKLNEVSKKDAYPLPRIEDNLDALAGAKWFCTLDLASGYWQVAMSEADRDKTAFCTRYGLYQWKVMPFGLCNAPGTFERLMEQVLAGLQWETILLYLDDVIVFGRTVEEEFSRLEEVFARMRKAGLKLKPKKCHLFKKEVSFLGHRVSQEGVATEEEKVEAVKTWPDLRSVKDVRAFLGLTGYYRRFIQDYAKVASPLINLTKKESKFEWGARERESFEALKSRLTTSPVLGYPNREGRFVLDTDASQCAIGAVLSQEQDGKEVVLAYGSRHLTASEKNYCVTRKELLAIVWFSEHFKHYLVGHKFLLRTDHHSLRWLFRFKEPEGQIARWLERLATFQFDIEHRAGIKHGNGDGMSRPPCGDECRYCTRQREKEEKPWTRVRAVRTRAETRAGRTGRARKRCQVTNDISAWMKQLLEWQSRDEVLKKMEDWVDRPKWETVSGEGARFKILWTKWKQIEKRDGLWHYGWRQDDGAPRWKVIVPEEGVESILKEHHDDKIAGHFGVKRTLNRLKASPYYWPLMRDSVEDWCRSCAVCLRTKPSNVHRKAPMRTYQSGESMERVGVDIMGPLTTSNSGNRFVIVVGDYWSKWIEAYAVPDHTAATVARYLVEEFFARFGLPRQLHSDQGREFEGHLFQEMCRLLEIDKTRTSPWRPCSNGYIERFNRTLGSMLRQVVDQKQKDWDVYLPLLTMAYRSTVHEKTGFTPNFMMLGRELPMPSHLIAKPPVDHSTSTQEYVTELKAKIRNAHEVARKTGNKQHERQKQLYNRKSRPPNLNVGDRVWLYNPSKKIGLSPKLTIFWEEEPYRIIDILNNVTAVISRGEGKKQRVVHVDKLQKCPPKMQEGRLEGREERQEEMMPEIREPTSVFEQMGLSHLIIPTV